MKAQNIIVTREIDGKPVVFEFRPLSSEDAGVMMGRLKARALYSDMIRKELELIEGHAEIPADPAKGLPAVPATPGIPIHLRDDAKYLALMEKRQNMSMELVKTIRPLFDQFEKPPVEEILKLSESLANTSTMVDVLIEIFARMFPSEDARKKS